ncbi:MAG: hypothetical protein ACJ71C_11410, partial [Nitrososphaeraceae archaeon]
VIVSSISDDIFISNITPYTLELLLLFPSSLILKTKVLKKMTRGHLGPVILLPFLYTRPFYRTYLCRPTGRRSWNTWN